MKILKPELLTVEKFAAYGDVITTENSQPISINSGNCLRYNDLASLDIDDSGTAGISLFDAKPYTSPMTLTCVERHPLGSQAFIPMSADPYLVIVADDRDGQAQPPKVFISNGVQGVNFRRNTWHGVLTPIATQALFAVVDYMGHLHNLEEFEFGTPYKVEF